MHLAFLEFVVPINSYFWYLILLYISCDFEVTYLFPLKLRLWDESLFFKEDFSDAGKYKQSKIICATIKMNSSCKFMSQLGFIILRSRFFPFFWILRFETDNLIISCPLVGCKWLGFHIYVELSVLLVYHRWILSFASSNCEAIEIDLPVHQIELIFSHWKLALLFCLFSFPTIFI